MIDRQGWLDRKTCPPHTWVPVVSGKYLFRCSKCGKRVR